MENHCRKVDSNQRRLTAEENAKLLEWRCGRHPAAATTLQQGCSVSDPVSLRRSLESIEEPTLGHMAFAPTL